MTKDIAFEMAVSSVRFGVGVTREIGMDLAEIAATLVLVVTDPVLAKLPPVQTVLESLERSGIPYALYDRVRVEPSDESFLEAIGYSSSDIPALVEGTLPQHRVTKLSPRPAGPEELARLFEDSMVAW